MATIFQTILILVSLSGGDNFPLLNKHSKKIDKVISSIWPEINTEVEGLYSESSDLKDVGVIGHIELHKVLSASDTAYVYVSQARSKVDDFDFLVVYNSDLNIQAVKVLQYRENHGGEISSKRFLRQFVGLSGNSNMKYGKDIDGISGATISVRAITAGIKRMSMNMTKLESNKML